jgi:quinol monooxygenase YgiN
VILTAAGKGNVFQLKIRLRARPHEVRGAIGALRSIVIATQAERGLLGSRIYQEAGNPEMLCLEEDWSGEPMLQSYIRSACFTDLLMLMETSSEAPVLEVHSVREVHGLEYVEAVRFGTK